MDDLDFWVKILDEMKRPDTAVWSAHTLAIGLGRGSRLENTNLGHALQFVPRSEILLATLSAYQNIAAHVYCDRILWYFEPEEIAAALGSLSQVHPNVKKGALNFLLSVESPWATILARELQERA